MGRKKSKYKGSVYLRGVPPETVWTFRNYCKENKLTLAEGFTDLITFAQASNLMKGFDDYHFEDHEGKLQ
jgi:hypothetical protein